MKVILINSRLVFQATAPVTQVVLDEHETWAGIVSSTGALSMTATYNSTAWKIKHAGAKHICTASYTGVESGASGWMAISYFDESKNFISGATMAVVAPSDNKFQDYEINAPEGAYYIVIPNGTQKNINSTIVEDFS